MSGTINTSDASGAGTAVPMEYGVARSPRRNSFTR